MAKSSRVRWVMASAALTPWPSSPTSQPSAPRYSISLEAFDLLPHLSLRRWISRRLREPSGSQPGSRKQDEAAIGVGQGDEDVAVRHREEPFVAIYEVGLARPAPRRGGTRGGLRRAQVRSGLLLGQGHADGAAGLALHGAGRRVVAGREDEGFPDGGELGLQAQRRNRRIGHAERTADAVLALVPEIGEHAARDMRAGLPGGPRQRMRAVADRQRHQLVPRRMELDLVDAVAEAVVAPELGQVAIGVARQLGDPRARHRLAGLGQKPVRPSDLLAAGDLGQQACRR